MLRSLDLSPILDAPLEERSSDFYSYWRPYFYGTLDPRSFIETSVDMERDSILALRGQSDGLLKGKKSSGRGRPKKGGVKAGARKESKSKEVDIKEFEQGTVVDWLSKAKAVLDKNHGTLDSGVVKTMVDGLLGALDVSSSGRERAQIAYVLRTLGHNPLRVEGSKEEVYSVIMEYDKGSGPVMVYASCDSFAFSYWHSGGVKLSIFDKGEASDLCLNLCSRAQGFIDRQTNGEEDSDLGENKDSLFDYIEDGVLPPPPVSPDVRFSIVTSYGIRSVSFASPSEISQELLGLYKGFNNLERLLGGKQIQESSNKSEDSQPADVYPLRLGLFGPKLAPLSSRWIAFLVDVGLYTLILGGVLYFLSPMVRSWGFLPSTIFYGFIFFLFPFLAAWMESSQEWGHATVGKKVMNMHVHGVNRPELSFAQALARNMSKFVLSPMFLFCGYVWAFFSPSRRTWHDLLGDSVVLDGMGDPFGVQGVFEEGDGSGLASSSSTNSGVRILE